MAEVVYYLRIPLPDYIVASLEKEIIQVSLQHAASEMRRGGLTPVSIELSFETSDHPSGNYSMLYLTVRCKALHRELRHERASYPYKKGRRKVEVDLQTLRDLPSLVWRKESEVDDVHRDG